MDHALDPTSHRPRPMEPFLPRNRRMVRSWPVATIQKAMSTPWSARPALNRHITAIRLEVLPDPSLTLAGGPGRSNTRLGNFHLNEVRVYVGGPSCRSSLTC